MRTLQHNLIFYAMYSNSILTINHSSDLFVAKETAQQVRHTYNAAAKKLLLCGKYKLQQLTLHL
jgi:hypothetical protein